MPIIYGKPYYPQTTQVDQVLKEANETHQADSHEDGYSSEEYDDSEYYDEEDSDYDEDGEDSGYGEEEEEESDYNEEEESYDHKKGWQFYAIFLSLHRFPVFFFFNF